jgi:Family of unknown function (DUF6298)/Putative collagen-binding domain of a collagenase
MNPKVLFFISLLVLGIAPMRAIADKAKGPLRIHPGNPRYFADWSGKAIYLTGSHTWNNLQDSGAIGKPVTRFDYKGYLDLLQANHHNFMRMWAWEGGENKSYYEPLCYRRTGPETALDGRPKFDLRRFDEDYFSRLRERVSAAGRRRIYVSIMLFQGWSIYNHGYGNPWPLHPFNKANNINGIDGDPNADGEGKEVHTLQLPAVTSLQEAYIRKVVDTVNDLDNVLYEITNETAIFSKDWQYQMVRSIKTYEATKRKQHAVGMTAFDSGRAGSMAALWASPADWISPQNDGTAGDFMSDPPAATGRKVIISDTDHLWGEGGDHRWVWKCFLRGYNPIYMDRIAALIGTPEGDIAGAEVTRRAMGYTRRLAERINLAAMLPHDELASTRYCLAHPGSEYLIYLPNGGEATVDLRGASGVFAREWINPRTGTITRAGTVPGGSQRTVSAPDKSDWVSYLRTSGSASISQ